MNFSEALDEIKKGKQLKRAAFRDTCHIEAQYPDEHSANTLPYLFMVKGGDRFPVDLSCESIFADDWEICGD